MSSFVKKWDRVEDNILKGAKVKLNTKVGKSLIVKTKDNHFKHGTRYIYFLYAVITKIVLCDFY